MFEAQKEEGIVGVSIALNWDVARKGARKLERHARQFFLDLEV
jgi:hypothetical protein